MKQIIILVFALCAGLNATAQLGHKLFPYRDGDKWGYCDHDGKVVITPQWDRADPFGHFSARVQIGKGQGAYYCLVDEKGKYIIPPSLHWTGSYSTMSSSEIMNINDSNGHVGRVDTNGHIIIPMKYDQNGSIYARLGQGFYRVYQNGKQGVLREDGSEVLHCRYGEIWHNSPIYMTPPAFLVTVNDSTSALLDTNGKTLISFTPLRTPNFRLTDKNNTVYYEVSNTYWIWESFPNGPRRQIPHKLEWLYNKNSGTIEGLFAMQAANGKWGFSDPKGKVLIAPEYDEVYVDTGDVIIVEKRLHNNNPQERYEYVRLNRQTLQPLDNPERNAKSGIETARRRQNEPEEVNDDYEERNRSLDEETDEEQEEEYPITHTKDKYLLHVPHMQEHYSRGEDFIPVTVFNEHKDLLGHTLVDKDLNLRVPPQPYKIEKVDLYSGMVTLLHNGQYALADTNLNILIGFQDMYIIERSYFTSGGKSYAIVSSNEETNRPGAMTYLVNKDGKTVPGFEQYHYVSIMNNENMWGWPVNHLAVKDSTGMMGITDLNGKTLYPKVSFKHAQITELGNNLFKVADKQGRNLTLVDANNKNLFPGKEITRIGYATPYYFYSSTDIPVKGIYIVHLKENNAFFYMNEKGTAFAKNIDTIAQPKR